MLLFPLLIGIFSALWNAIAEGGAFIAVPPHAMVWYLAITEWILLSAPHPEFDLEQLVRRGDIEHQLTLPISLVALTVAQGMGTLLVQAPIFIVSAAGSAWWFGGGLPDFAGNLRWAIPCGLLAMLVLLVFHTTLGLLSFWFHRIAPFCWIWQKAAFVLGGLMLPLSLYPERVQRVATWTPFPALLYGPARFMLTQPEHLAPNVLLTQQLAWLLFAAVLAVSVYHRAISKIVLRGT
ncbi:MAG TPA: ABC-2 family transporter protein [Polyangiaceae bacterium]